MVLSFVNEIHFDETWGYEHMKVASDTHVVCDWSAVTPHSMEMPECGWETCPGHKAEDVLPFNDLIQEGVTYTNEEFYDLIAPGSMAMP